MPRPRPPTSPGAPRRQGTPRARRRLRPGTDRVGRNEAHPAAHRVGDHRRSVEEPVLVVAKRKIVERAAPVLRHHRARPLPLDGMSGGGEPQAWARCHQEPQRRARETDPERHEHRRHKMARARQRERPVAAEPFRDGPCRFTKARMVSASHRDRQRDAARECGQRSTAPEKGRPARGGTRRQNGKRAPPAREPHGRGHAERGLLDVEALDDVECHG